MPRSQQPDAGRTEPYLESLDATEADEVAALAWARYLVARFGVAGAVRALAYYEDVGWIGPAVRREMAAHVRTTEAADDVDPAAAPAETPESLVGTPFEAHAGSLAYVAAIAGDSLDAALQALRLPEATGPGDGDDAGAAMGETAPERVGVAGDPADAATFHRLGADGERSQCGMLDADAETVPDVATVLSREAAVEAGLSPCTHCRDATPE